MGRLVSSASLENLERVSFECKRLPSSENPLADMGARLIKAFGLKSTRTLSSAQVIGRQPAINASGIFSV